MSKRSNKEDARPDLQSDVFREALHKSIRERIEDALLETAVSGTDVKKIARIIADCCLYEVLSTIDSMLGANRVVMDANQRRFKGNRIVMMVWYMLGEQMRRNVMNDMLQCSHVFTADETLEFDRLLGLSVECYRERVAQNEEKDDSC